MVGRRLRWILIPAVAGICLAGLLVVAVQDKPDPAFDFLTKLHPTRGPVKPIASTTSITGGRLDKATPPSEHVLAFPGARAKEINDLVTSRFGPEVGSMAESGSMVVNGVVVSQSGRQSLHTDGNGRQVIVVSGQYIDDFLPLLRSADIPHDSCLVVTVSPPTGIEVFLAKLRHFLHLR